MVVQIQMHATITKMQMKDGSCEFPQEYYDCFGNCINDSDLNGICDELEVSGCTDSEACNYNANATMDNGTCEYLELH